MPIFRINTITVTIYERPYLCLYLLQFCEVLLVPVSVSYLCLIVLRGFLPVSYNFVGSYLYLYVLHFVKAYLCRYVLHFCEVLLMLVCLTITVL